MARGIIYTMTTVVPGLIKIGKTGSDNYKQRMDNLERNGYSNVAGLKRSFAIEVEDYDEKELLLHSIFSKSRVDRTELFSADIQLVNQLLAAFEGKQIYPVNETKDEVFDQLAETRGIGLIPDGKYSLKRTVGSFSVHCKMSVEGDKWTLLEGSTIAPIDPDNNLLSDKANKMRSKLNVNADGVLVNDYVFKNVTPSLAANVVTGKSCNGWIEWKNSKGEPVDVYRDK